MPGNPIKLSDFGPDSYSPPPELGHDTDAVLRELLGKSAHEIARPSRRWHRRVGEPDMVERVTINEVSLRDGLQNQPRAVDTANKLALLEALLAAGISHVEATSFVSAKAVPQMADAADIMARLPERDRIDYSVLVPNVKGYERARAAAARSVAVTLSCTETMNGRQS